jgi:hypothetical protein
LNEVADISLRLTVCCIDAKPDRNAPDIVRRRKVQRGSWTMAISPQPEPFRTYRVWWRKGNNFTRRFPQIAAALPVRSFLIDREAVVVRRGGACDLRS